MATTGMNSTANSTGRVRGTGRFGPGNKFGHRFPEGNAAATGSAGRPSSEVKAILHEAGLEAIPRIREIAATPKHKDHFKANTWLAERGLKDDLEGHIAPKPSEAVQLPAWGKTESVQ